MVSEARGFNEGNAMTKVRTTFLFVAGFALGAWASLGINDTARTADQPANSPTSSPPAAASANPAPGGQGATTGGAPASPGAEQPQAGQPAGQPQAGGGVQASAGGGGNPQDIAKSAEKGSLKSPYQDFKKVAEEGHQKFMSAGCNGCHGGTGGGGMGPPLTNQIWVYGSDDDTLFRLIAVGTDQLQKQGYSRKGSENVVGPMPPMGTVLKAPDNIWKVIAWIRSVNPSSAGGGAGPSASAAPPAPPSAPSAQ
jgi:mono/diheme cytochrome c family protein